MGCYNIDEAAVIAEVAPMRPEHRCLHLALAVALFVAAPAVADEAPPGAGRYSLGASKDGFVRLDTATGAVSHCRQWDGVWRCETLPGEDAALNARLDALSGEVARLSAALAALDSRVAALARIDRDSRLPPTATGDEESPKAEGLAKRMMGRFFDMVRALKYGNASPTPAAT